MKGLNTISSKYTSIAAGKALERYCLNKGHEIFDYELLDESVRGLYLVPHEIGYEMLKSYCKKIGESELAEKCVIEYIAHHQFQAFAVQQDGYYFIGISTALPTLLQTLFQNLFSLTNPLTQSLQDIHKADKESDIEGAEYIFPDLLMKSEFNRSRLIDEINELLKDTIPVERWQRVMSTKMAEMAIAFCVAHEIGHLVSGHTDIIGKRAFSESSELGFAAQNGKRTPGSWLSQSWEIQADKIGMALLYSYAIGSPKQRDKFMHYFKCRDKAEIYGRILYAVYLVFLLLGQQQFIIKTAGTHPAAITRITYLMAFLGTLMVNQDKYPAQFAGDLVERYAEMAEAAWGRIGFSAGRHQDTIDDLPLVVKDLQRAEQIVQQIFGSFQWAIRFKS